MKSDILNEVATVVKTIVPATYVYPDEYNDIPTSGGIACIVQEQRAVNNNTNIEASFFGVHSWNVEMLVIIARGGRVAYPSKESAEQDIAANTIELEILTALIGADFTDAINNKQIISNIGWYQWENNRNKNEGVYAVQVLMNVQQLIDFT